MTAFAPEAELIRLWLLGEKVRNIGFLVFSAAVKATRTVISASKLVEKVPNGTRLRKEVD